MKNEASFSGEPDMINELRQCAELLVKKLEDNNYDEASILIKSLKEHRDQHIYQCVGRLTRGLHNSIVNLSDADTSKQAGHFSDTSERLNYVIDLTKDAANKTMDIVDECTPISNELASSAVALKTSWSALNENSIDSEEFADFSKNINVFFEKMDSGTSTINTNLQNIVVEQGYQDLTGQVLKRAIELVAEVEEELVSLVRVAGQVEEVLGVNIDEDTSTITEPEQTSSDSKKPLDLVGEGPQINAATRDDVVNGQDDVDDLLSSLGF